MACKVKEHRRQGWWGVFRRHCNYSAFNGYRRTYSAYSEVCCAWCMEFWRTKASYVDHLPNWSRENWTSKMAEAREAREKLTAEKKEK